MTLVAGDKMTTRKTLASVLFLSLLALATEAEAQGLLAPALSGVIDGCRIDRGPVAERVPLHRDDALWLACGDQRMVVVHPDNLVGKVRLRSVQQALEFVRLFSSQSTRTVVHMGGCVEIVEGDKSEQFYAVGTSVFRKHLKPASVEQSDPGARQQSFIITRPVACSDGRVYELKEQVDDNGLYYQIRKRFIVSAKTIGIHVF